MTEFLNKDKDRKSRWLVAAVLLVLVAAFFTAAVWDIGAAEFPDSNCIPHRSDLRLDLGATTYVESVCILIQEDKPVEVDIYSGSPGDWELRGSLDESGTWQQWRSVSLGCSTQYVRLNFKKADGEIGEVAVYGGGRRLTVQRITDNSGNEKCSELIDEPSLVASPPTYEDGTYFDEIYFVRTAEEHLHLEEAFEWSHPPLGKLIISLGIIIFGSNPFAWRITSAVAAAVMVYIAYLLGRRMLGTPRAGLIVALLLALDFMHFSEARMATGETFLALFLLLMFYFFARYYQGNEYRGRDLFLSLLCFGLAFSVKWVAIFGLVALVVLFILTKKHQGITRGEANGLAGGMLAAVAVYFLAYIPYFLGGHGLTDFFNLQFSMFGYHSGLEATHPYTSPWWSWPYMWRPMWLYTGQFEGWTSNIVLMGNPILWWASLPCLLLTAWLAVRHRDRTAIFIAVAFAAQWILFAAIPRILFIYHYYLCVIFTSLAVTFWLERLWPRRRWVVITCLGLALLAFCLLYPLISGTPVATESWPYRVFQWFWSW